MSLICLSACLVLVFEHYMALQKAVLDERLEFVHRLRNIAEAAPMDIRRLDDMSTMAKSFLHEGQTGDVVSASILAEINKLAVEQGIQIMRSGVAPADPQNGLSIASTFVEMTGSESGIYGFLQRIESSKPVLMVIKLQIRGDNVARADQVVEPSLSAVMNINGVLLPTFD